MVYILLIPFDVFATVREYSYLSSFKSPFSGVEYAVTIYDLYFCMYICLIVLTFIGLPFSYFYAQIVQEEEDVTDDGAGYEPLGHSESGPKAGLKGMDSSGSSEEEKPEHQDYQITLNQDEDAQDIELPQETDSLTQSSDTNGIKQSSARRRESSMETLIDRSKRALQKTVSVFSMWLDLTYFDNSSFQWFA